MVARTPFRTTPWFLMIPPANINNRCGFNHRMAMKSNWEPNPINPNDVHQGFQTSIHAHMALQDTEQRTAFEQVPKTLIGQMSNLSYAGRVICPCAFVHFQRVPRAPGAFWATETGMELWELCLLYSIHLPFCSLRATETENKIFRGLGHWEALDQSPSETLDETHVRWVCRGRSAAMLWRVAKSNFAPA